MDLDSILKEREELIHQNYLKLTQLEGKLDHTAFLLEVAEQIMTLETYIRALRSMMRQDYTEHRYYDLEENDET